MRCAASRLGGLPDRCVNGRPVALRGSGVEAGFTLIELVISAALMGIILVAGYACMNAAVSARKLMDPRLEAAQGARGVLDLISADLRCACPLVGDSAFLGIDRTLGSMQADSLDFATHHYTPRRPGEGDFCTVGYFVERDPKTGLHGLWRRRHPGIPLEGTRGGRKEELVTGVRKLNFEYYDGFEWYESWGDTEGGGRAESSRRERSNLTGMPEAVRITLWMDPDPRPLREGEVESATPEPAMVYQTVARLVLAATASSGSSGSSSGTAPGGVN